MKNGPEAQRAGVPKVPILLVTVRTKEDPRAGRTRGKVIFPNTWILESPPIAPASSSSESIVRKAPDIRRNV